MTQTIKRWAVIPGHGVRVSGGLSISIPPNAKRIVVRVPTDEPDLPDLPRAERNAMCPCGSQKKFKKCCYLTNGVSQT